MKNYTKEQLSKISTDLEQLKLEIRESWGNIFIDFENNNILPNKALLLEIGDAVVFPFLFKHYFIEDNELRNIKEQITKNNNGNSLSKKDTDINQSVYSFIAEDEIKSIKSVLNNSFDDFSNYDVIVDSIVNREAIDFLPSIHNVKLLERLNKENVSVIFDIDNEDDSNLDWLLNIISNITPNEFDKITPELSNKLTFFMLEYLTNDSNTKKLLSLPSFLNNFHKNYKYVNLSDFYDFGVVGVDSEVIYSSFERAWKREELDKKDGAANISQKLFDFINQNLDIERVKSITGNSIMNFWSSNDLNNNTKNSLLKKYLPYYNGVLTSNENISSEFINEELYNSLTREDAINFFNNVAKTVDVNDYMYIYNSNLQNLKEIDFDSDKLDLVAMLISKIYDNNEGLSPLFNVNKMSASIFDVMDTENWTDRLIENGGIISLFKMMLKSEDFAKFENSYSVFKKIKSDIVFERKFKNEINDFLSTNINFDKALLIGMFYSNDVSLMDKVKSSLHSLDLELLKEIGVNVSSSNGNNVPLSQNENNVLLRLLEIDEPDTDLLNRALSSNIYKKRLSKSFEIKNKDKFKNVIELLRFLDTSEKDFMISLIGKEIKKNPDLMTNLDDELKKNISKYKVLRSFVPSQKIMSYSMFILSVGSLNEFMKAYPGGNYPEGIKDKVALLDSEIENIPSDIKFNYVKKFINDDDWETCKLNSSLDWHLSKALMETKKELSFSDIKKIRYWGNKESNTTLNFTESYDKLTPTSARLLVSIIEHNFMSNNCSLYIESIEHLLNDKKSRKYFFDAIKEKPILILNNAIFKFSFDLTDNEKKNILLDGLNELNSKENKFALSQTLMRNIDSDKLKIVPKEMSVSLLTELKESVSSVQSKFLLSVATKGMIPNYMDIKSFLDVISGANKLNPSLENKLLENFKLSEDDLLKYASSDEKFIKTFELPYGCLFPELINHDFVRDNSVEFADFITNCDLKIKYNYISDFYVMGKFINITEGLNDIIKEDSVKIQFSDFHKGISAFIESDLPVNQISNFILLDDDNFSVFMNSIIDGDSFNKKDSVSNIDNKFNDKKIETISEIISQAFLNNNLSDINKVFLLNAIELSIISDKILDNSGFGNFGKTVLTDEKVLNNAIVFKNKKHINNVFTDFNANSFIDVEEDNNEFKI